MRFVRTLIGLLVISCAFTAQAANQYLRLQGVPVQGYIEIPASDLLDTPAQTVEAWVWARDPHGVGGCSSIAGNGYATGWWLGVCGTTMRSYFNGVSSAKDGGVIPDVPGVWMHIAAVTDGTTRKHYINGKLVLQTAETAVLAPGTKALRIGSDPDWNYMIAGAIDDLRIWRVARTQEQIRQTMFALYIPDPSEESGRFASLEAWYRFEGNANDSWHTHHGTIIGNGIGFESGAAFQLPRRRAAGH
jgi:hypothetical protein